MPQGGRKAAFSGKAKKQQMQAKKSRNKRNDLERSEFFKQTYNARM
jgi:hypothetical protein